MKKKARIRIVLPSRRIGVETILEQTDDPNIFNVISNGTTYEYVRIIFDGEKDDKDRTIKHIDFEGGPFISVGNTELYEGHTLKEIVSEVKGYKFIFSKNEDKE